MVALTRFLQFECIRKVAQIARVHYFPSFSSCVWWLNWHVHTAHRHFQCAPNRKASEQQGGFRWWVVCQGDEASHQSTQLQKRMPPKCSKQRLFILILDFEPCCHLVPFYLVYEVVHQQWSIERFQMKETTVSLLGLEEDASEGDHFWSLARWWTLGTNALLSIISYQLSLINNKTAKHCHSPGGTGISALFSPTFFLEECSYWLVAHYFIFSS